MKVLRVKRVEITEDAQGLKIVPVQGLRISIAGEGSEAWVEGDLESLLREFLDGDGTPLTVLCGDMMTGLGFGE
jgi:hypothetical protein